MTDQNGRYSVKVKKGAGQILVLSLFSGAIEQAIDGRTEINFVLSDNAPLPRKTRKPSILKIRQSRFTRIYTT